MTLLELIKTVGPNWKKISILDGKAEKYYLACSENKSLI
jgi:hypothetical protein